MGAGAGSKRADASMVTVAGRLDCGCMGGIQGRIKALEALNTAATIVQSSAPASTVMQNKEV